MAARYLIDSDGNVVLVLATDLVSDEAYAASWDSVTNQAPSKNAVYDELEFMFVRAAILGTL